MAPSITRIFHRLAAGRAPLVARATVQLENPMLAPAEARPFDPAPLFVKNYPVIKRALEQHRRQGLLTVAIGAEGRPVGQAWLAASLDRSRSMIVGRHPMCDLMLPEPHTDISLRHLVVLVRAASHQEVGLRVLDLHTQTGFSDEAGRALHAVSAEGAVFLKLGPVTLMMLPTEEAGVIADDGAAQYATIPARVFVEERLGVAGDAPKRVPLGSPVLLPSVTSVRSHDAAIAAAGPLCGEDEAPFGTLTVRGGGGSARRPVGSAFLERGLLVGRYGRCDVGVSFVETSRLSRVHLLVLKDKDEVLAIDTGSANGTRLGEREIRLHVWQSGEALDLGGELELVWHR